MKDAGSPPTRRSHWPPGLASALTAFERYLRAQHSCRRIQFHAYAADIRSLLEHAGVNEHPDAGDLSLAQLPPWLTVQHFAGGAQTTSAPWPGAARRPARLRR